jgi:nicotinate-nucleotide pyrophosphorylase (carboxylating)
MNLTLNDLQQDIQDTVAWALKEDVGSGDITAQLIPASNQSRARIICRDHAVITGVAWVNEVFKQVDSHVEVTWLVKDV